MECSTSKLSPRLRIGTLSPNELYNKVENSDLEDVDRTHLLGDCYCSGAILLTFIFPEMRDRSIRSHYEDTEWVDGGEETTPGSLEDRYDILLYATG